MEHCKNCTHYVPQAEGRYVCSNELSSALGLDTDKNDYCMEYCEDVSTWNLADASVA